MATWIGYALAFLLAVLWGREIRSRGRDREEWARAENTITTLESATQSFVRALRAEKEINNDWRLRIIALREVMGQCDPSIVGDLMADALNKLLADKTGSPEGGGAAN
jgi:hypothetical protein